MKAFVLMPFDSDFRPVYEQLIKAALEKAGYEVRRADSALDQQNILCDIVRGIYEADLIVADLTGLNPNVFYELGICHGLNIPCVLLTQSVDEVPFDLKPYRLKRYSTVFHEAKKLSDFLENLGIEHTQGKIRFGSPVSDHLDFPPPAPSAARILHNKTSTQAQQLRRSRKTIGPSISADEGATENAEEKEHQKDEEMLGWLDLVSEREQMIGELGAVYQLLAESFANVGERMRQHYKEIAQLTASEKSGMVPAINQVASQAARDIDGHSREVEDLLEDLEPKSERLVALLVETTETLERRDKRNSESVAKRITDLEAFLDANQKALSGVEKFRDSARSLRERGISRELNRASSKLKLRLDRIIQSIELVQAGVVRVVAILKERSG